MLVCVALYIKIFLYHISLRLNTFNLSRFWTLANIGQYPDSCQQLLVIFQYEASILETENIRILVPCGINPPRIISL